MPRKKSAQPVKEPKAPVAPKSAKVALNQMKLEIANEIGLANYESADKGNLTARQNGYVGGYMTKKLVEMAKNQMTGK